MAGQYNHVASDDRSRDLKRWLKLYGLERLYEDSKGSVLKTFNSCKFSSVIFCAHFGQLFAVNDVIQICGDVNFT